MKRTALMAAALIPWFGAAAFCIAGTTPAGSPAAVMLLAQRAQQTAAGMISGRVVDDETGDAIVDFVVQTSTPNSARPDDVFWNHYMMGIPQTPGQFRARTPTARETVRILAPGYVPQILTEQSLANQPATGLEIRLKRGGALQGVVTDDAGRPVARARVLVGTVQRVFLMDGKFEYGEFRGASTTTDDTGRFALRGDGTGREKVVIISPDGNLVWPVIQSTAGEEMKITLPKPGSLVVRYDIPGDLADAKPELRLITTNKDRLLWSNVSFGFSATVTNGGQIVLTNLTPGLYHYRRWKSASREYGAEIDAQTVLVEAGRTGTLDLVRTNGQRVRGQVTGANNVLAAGGLILVRSAGATGQPWPQRSRNEQNDFNFPTFDVLKFGADGAFETAMLKPGDYTVVADVFPPGGQAGGFPYHPDYVGVAKITVPGDPLTPVNLELAPALYVNIEGRGFDDETGRAIPDLAIQSGKVNPDKPGEITWNEGMSGLMQGFGVGPGQFSIWNQKTGDALRFIANGYLPQSFTREEIIASRQTANLQVRMKHGGEIHGTVLNHSGRPEVGAAVYLAPLEQGHVRFGWVMSSGTVTNWAHTHATTDAAGRFSMRGVGEQPRLIVVSADGQMVQPVEASGPGQDMKITLPEPASLVVHYDIPGDMPEAYCELALHTNDLELPLWKYVTLKTSARVANGGQTVLNNLTPGTYDFSRSRMGGGSNATYMFIFGDPPGRVDSDGQTVFLHSGRTQHVRLVRSRGQRVQGQVTGLGTVTNLIGTYLYVSSVPAAGSAPDFTGKLDPCYDAVKLGSDGLFQTALLEPGNYTLMAETFSWGKAPEHRVYADDEPQYGGMFMNPQRIIFAGSVNVAVTSQGASAPVKLELRPWVQPAKTP